RWHLASRHHAPWKWLTPSGMTAPRGTAVRLILRSFLKRPGAGFIIPCSHPDESVVAIARCRLSRRTLRRHFEPLLDPAFDDLLRRHYRDGIGFEIDGRELARAGVLSSERAPISIGLGRRRTPSATGFIERHVFPPDDREGIAISTFGTVIKRGWDWL